VLHLASETPAAWVTRIWPDFDEVLLDHAHCEMKAASTAIGLVFRLGEHRVVVDALSALAQEEMDHFRQVLAVLDARGVPFRRQRASDYARRLREGTHQSGRAGVLDTLLCCALIEARSCERMKLLSQHLPDAELRSFYGELLASEARHFTVYQGLAAEIFSEDAARDRLAALAEHEAQVLATAEPEPRMHA
jgi:tRNA-(ms[2]io[6]A)-hydroxylase